MRGLCSGYRQPGGRPGGLRGEFANAGSVRLSCVLGGSVRLPLLALVAMLSGCARENPAYGGGAADAGQTDGQTGGSTAGATGAATTKTSASAGSTASAGDTSGLTGDPDASGTTVSRPTGDGSVGETAPFRTTSGGSGGCENITLDVLSDTFVSNAEEGCGGDSCTGWTFTGVTTYEIRSAGTFDSIMLLRFGSDEPVTVTQATLRLQVGGAVPNDPGLVELHVLETLSVWADGSHSGPEPGEPTWNRAASGGAPWINGAGARVGEFDELHDNWPTLLVAAGDGADGVLELPIQATDLPELNARLASSAPVQIGVTILTPSQEGAITALTMDDGAFAQLELVVDCR